MISAKIRSAIRVLRLIAQGARTIDGDTATALIPPKVGVSRQAADGKAKPPVRLVTSEEPSASPPKTEVPERASFQAWLDMGEEVESDLEDSVTVLRAEKAWRNDMQTPGNAHSVAREIRASPLYRALVGAGLLAPL